MNKILFFLLISAQILFFSVAKAQDTSVVKGPAVWIDLPLYDYPFNSTKNPPDLFSMRQSMALSNSFLQTANYLIGGEEAELEGAWWKYVLVTLFDYGTGTIPVGNGWVHEEWHRAVMTHRKIGSFNDMNTFPFGKNIVAVSHEDDIDFINLKKYHPADQVRMSSAGMEAQVFQNMSIEESHFFGKSRGRDVPLLWLNALNVYSYMATCASDDSNSETDKLMREEGSDVSVRDFTGLDCNGWVYDMFRPDEPYEARGTHPSGVGLKRYIKYSDLSEKEKDFLKLQTKLSLLNLVDPFMFTLNEFNSNVNGTDVRWNFKLNHYITSFGGTVDANLFLDFDHKKFLATLHNGMTDTRYLPGFTLKWIDNEVADKIYTTVSGTIWQQPKDQRIESSSQSTLLDASFEVAYKFQDRWQYYLGVEQKNAGWIAGNVYLEDGYQVWTGVRAGIF